MKVRSLDPKAFHDFFAEVKEGQAVLIVREKTGLYMEATENTDDPEASVKSHRVNRESLLAVIKLVAAIISGRPIKLVPDSKAYWKAHIGPKP